MLEILFKTIPVVNMSFNVYTERDVSFESGRS